MSQISFLTGAKITVRKLKASEVEKIISSKPRNFLSVLLEVLSSCTLSVEDVGIYESSFPWKKLYEGDWFDALFQLREISLGKDYEYTLKCPRCGSFQAHQDLSLLKRKAPSPEILDLLKENKNRFLVPFSLGQVEIIIPNAEESIAIYNAEKKLAVVRSKNSEESLIVQNEDILIDQLRKKILRIILPDGEILEGQKKNAFLDCDIDVADELITLIEDTSFGIQMELETNCPSCSEEIEFTLPMQKTFFLPRRRKL